MCGVVTAQRATELQAGTNRLRDAEAFSAPPCPPSQQLAASNTRRAVNLCCGGSGIVFFGWCQDFRPESRRRSSRKESGGGAAAVATYTVADRCRRAGRRHGSESDVSPAKAKSFFCRTTHMCACDVMASMCLFSLPLDRLRRSVNARPTTHQLLGGPEVLSER